MSVKKPALHMLLIYFSVVLASFIAVMLLTEIKTVEVSEVTQLSDIDFSGDVALLSIDCYERYQSALYTPEDFAVGNVTQTPSDEHPTMEHGFGTYRIVLQLPPGEVYGISAYTATYAQKLWIDGKLVSQMGTPSDSIDTTVPKTSYFTAYFTASDMTEIVLQRSDFVHANGGQVYPLYLGLQKNITALSNGILLRGILVAGCSLMAALFFFGIFLFFRKMPHLLWFSLACLSVTIYTLILDHKLIMLLFPDMSWAVSHRLEYTVGGGMVFFFFLHVVRMFRLRVSQPVNIFGICILCTYMLCVLFTPSLVYTMLMPYLRACGALYCLGALVILGRSMVKYSENRKAEHFLIYIGAIIYVALTFVGIPLHSTGRYNDSSLFRLGLMLMVFANTLALAISFTRTEAALNEARQKQRELDESNQMLDSLNEMKTQFMANISHELKTPLTVVSVNAQVSKTLLYMDSDKSEITRNLDAITDETRRMARMVSEVLDLSSIQEGRSGFGLVDIDALLTKTAGIYRTLLEKRGNALTLSIADDLPQINGNADMLVQVVVNLLANANAHTVGGEISLACNARNGVVTVIIGDNGKGIPKALLPHVFKRHHSGDEAHSTGLGLAICKDIIERHGGEIGIESTEGMGVIVQFTLPACTEGDEEHG